MTLKKLQLLLVKSFIFFGLLGNILTPYFLPSAFRFFYFLLPLFPLFYYRSSLKMLTPILLFFPFLFYYLASSYIAQVGDLYTLDPPLLRSLLFIFEFLFSIGAAYYLRDEEKNPLIRFYLLSFFLSLLIGYFFYIGFYQGLLPLSILERFSVETQFGYTLLRFSPGSYPNEYGIISSFVLSILTLLIAEKKTPFFELNFSRFFLYFFYILTFIALILTTTRAAFLAYLISCLYLFVISKPFRRKLFKLVTIALSIFFALNFFFHNLLKIVITSFKLINFSSKAVHTGTGIRIYEWIESLKAFNDSALLGLGTGTSSIHNTYIQLISELGLVGISLLIITLFFYLGKYIFVLRFSCFKRWMLPEDIFFNRVLMLGFIHVFSFAMSNHNLHHHLTWFVFLLFNINVFRKAYLTSKIEIGSLKPLSSSGGNC